MTEWTPIKVEATSDSTIKVSGGTQHAALGDLHFDVDDQTVVCWDGSAWVQIRSAFEKLGDAMAGVGKAIVAQGDVWIIELGKPHALGRDGEGFWECGKCGLRAWDPSLITSLECGSE